MEKTKTVSKKEIVTKDVTICDSTAQMIEKAKRDGKIRYGGMSATPAEWIVEARHISDQRGHLRIRSEQVLYNLFSRGIERDVLP